MSTYDDSGREVFWGWDTAGDIGLQVPGSDAVSHAFDVKVSRRRATSRCGLEMLTYAWPAEVEYLRFDSYRIPVCRECAEAVGGNVLAALKQVKARFTRKRS